MKITRILTYEGSPEELESQIGNSLPDGSHPFHEEMKLTILTVGNASMLAVYQDLEAKAKEENK